MDYEGIPKTPVIAVSSFYLAHATWRVKRKKAPMFSIREKEFYPLTVPFTLSSDEPRWDSVKG